MSGKREPVGSAGGSSAVRASRPARRVPASRAGAGDSAGLTLLELLLALAGTAFIGAAISAMLVSVSYGTSSARGMLEMTVQQRVAHGRIDAAVRASRRILAAGRDIDAEQTYLVLWIADTRDNDKPDLSELRLLELDEASGDLRSYTASFAESMSLSEILDADTTWELDANFRSAVETAKSGDHFPATRWASDVGELTITLDASNLADARLVGYRLTMTLNGFTDTSVSAAALRHEEALQ